MILDAIPPPVLAAAVGGGFLALGWVVNGWQNRRDAAQLRRERTRDVHRALYAEIGAHLANLRAGQGLEVYRDEIIARMRADPQFLPFVPRERPDHLFDAIVADIHVLPRITIDPVVAYYSQIKAISDLASDMRGATFAGLPQDRRIEIYSDYMLMKEQALRFGELAKTVIAAYASGGVPAAERAARQMDQ